MGTRGEVEKGDLDLARCSERIYFFGIVVFIGAVAARATADRWFLLSSPVDVTNCAGFRDGYATSAHYAVTICR